MSELPVSRKFRYDLDELYTKLRKKEITEEDFSIQRDALIAQEAKAHETMGPILITKQLEATEADIIANVDKRFQEEEQEENERAARERFARIAERKRIEREEQARQDAIEAENRRITEERNLFRSKIEREIEDLEQKTNRWQTWSYWLQIILIVITATTTLTVGFSSIPRPLVLLPSLGATILSSILSLFKLQDKVYSGKKALADLRLECQMYDHRIGEYQNRREDPEGTYLIFSKKVTTILANQMLQEVELLNPNKKEDTSETKEAQKKEIVTEKESQEGIKQEETSEANKEAEK